MLRLIHVLCLVVLAGCAGGRAARGGDDGTRQSLEFQGTRRTYVVRVPSNLPAGRVPLVIVLHGGGGNAFNAERMTGFTPKAEREGFIVVYPDGTGRTELRTWNAGHCCGYAMENSIDDVGFIRALIDKLVAPDPRSWTLPDVDA